MRLILDLMGGDNAPLEILKGAALAVREYPDVELTVIGREAEIRELSSKEKIPLWKMTLIDAYDVVTMEDSPRSVVSTKKNSSMAIGLKALADGEGDAFISAGNTGALMTGATMLVGCFFGIKRAAIATVLPMENPVLLIDSGSNVTVTPELLCQFGILGSAYMEKVFGIKNARVGLLNNGTEEHKGTPIIAETHKLLSKNDEINFVGNIEGKQIPFDICDVLVTDGFTGNIVLKTVEGISKFILKKLKSVYSKNPKNMLSAALIKGDITSLKEEFDASGYGGAPFLGISKPVFKAHGSSDATAIKNAIRQAREYVTGDVQRFISERISTKNE